MSDVGPYGVTQHADAEMVTANQLVGQRLDHPTQNAVGNVSQAAFSTAPYKPKPSERKVGSRGCTHNNGTCNAPAMKGRDICFFHEPSEPPSRINPMRSRR